MQLEFAKKEEVNVCGFLYYLKTFHLRFKFPLEIWEFYTNDTLDVLLALHKLH